MKKIVKKTVTKSEVGGAAAGLAAIMAAAAGAYFLYGSKDATKNRKHVKSWSIKMKAEVLEKIEKLKEVDQKVYQDIIDAVSKKYSALKGIEVTEVEKISKELSSHLRAIKKNFDTNNKNVKKVVKKTVSKVAKKVSKVTKK